MLKRLILAAALAAGLASPAFAQMMGQAVQIQDYTGNAVGPTNPLSVSGAPSATAGNGIAPTPGATSSAYVAKASGANLYGFSVTMGATAGFLALLNTTTAPVAAAAITPLECIAVPANGYVARRQDIPDRYGTGLTVVVSSSCTTYTAVTPVLTTVLVQ